ncbi:MarR family transcriptional regulator [Clostridium estertheticum]|uniref:MarR family winged helix-turn-helix transcriptional regulator n=1 Tax=Clostridium estertheticum TaxID=238834 RepID=UPI001CF30303|nr:MarR family transcriptional regulator [Clostridium estertheticum]MCB2305424.1 MarR family transcriptional regulator [Clostridium estertheticum]MCB2343862.1 MarR family transcriptional regulator [Clostridium estertheticum]MCB2348780.1 MarR family transcriptional regulator [Clostridium estertheticum]WAG46100.1 MarR family transcriptional regulator [Clostridium estertheticum]
MKEDIMHLLKLNNQILRSTQVHLDKMLKEYDLSSGSYPYLLMLRGNEGISQNKISEEVGCDKAMSARTITKLIDIGYIIRNKDEDDSRAYKLYLTQKAKVIIPKVLYKIHKLVELITKDLNEEEKRTTINSLSKVLNSVKKMKIQG